jgi:hypothetical protein
LPESAVVGIVGSDVEAPVGHVHYRNGTYVGVGEAKSEDQVIDLGSFVAGSGCFIWTVSCIRGCAKHGLNNDR